jgi:hypothetical protein
MDGGTEKAGRGIPSQTLLAESDEIRLGLEIGVCRGARLFEVLRTSRAYSKTMSAPRR